MNVPNNLEGNLPRNASVAPVVLAILDGWGICDSTEHNAIRSASTPVIDALWHAYPHALIEASGSHVGLPDGQMGNSEVGHLTIGAGRIIRQELVRISETVREQRLGSTSALQSVAERLRSTGGTLHLLGLCSDGGVHSHVDHVCGLLEWAAEEGLKNVAIHAITDGRDTPDPKCTNTPEQNPSRDQQSWELAAFPVSVGATGRWIATIAGREQSGLMPY